MRDNRGRPLCDMCNKAMIGRGQRWQRVVSHFGDHYVCGQCLNLALELIGFMCERRKELALKRPGSVAQVLPVDVFAGVTFDSPPGTARDVQDGGNVA